MKKWIYMMFAAAVPGCHRPAAQPLFGIGYTTELQTDFARFTIVCSVMEDSQVLHIWAWLPFDVENEQDALTMAVACHALNGYMILGKYTYNLEKDVALELDHFYGDGIDMDAVRRLLEGIFRPSLEEDGQRLIDLHNGKLAFDRFLTLIQE